MKHDAKKMELPTSDDMDFRRPVLIGLLIFSLVFLSWHSSVEFMFGIRLLAFMEAALLIYSLFILYFVSRRPYARGLALSIIVPILLLLILAMMHPDTPRNVFIWALPVPVLTYSLLGRNSGFLLTLMTSLLSLFAYFSRFGDMEAKNSLLSIADAVICLSIVWVISHLYEQYHEKNTKALQRLASTDELTGLHNRRYLKKTFNHLSLLADRRQQMLAVLVMDIDHFKRVNDQWGHDAGDAVLVHVARLIHDTLRQSDWAFRTGGEEFCLFLTVDGREGAMKAAESVRNKISEHPYYYRDLSIPLSASIGIALYPEEGRDFEKLLRLADQHMYQAKEQGRNRVIGASPVTEYKLKFA